MTEESFYDENGVDVTLVRWFLSLTPAERVAWLQESIDAVEEIWRLNGIEPTYRRPADAG